MSKWHIGTPTEFGTFNGSHVNDEEGDSVCQMYGLPVNIRFEDIDPKRYKKELRNLILVSMSPELLEACEMAEYCLDPDNAEIVTDEDIQRTLSNLRTVISLARNEE